MFRTLIPWLVLSSVTLGAESSPQAGTQLVYRGGLGEFKQGTKAEPSKTFDLTLLVTDADEASTQLYWLVDERGNGAWGWAERFGKLALDPHGRPAGSQGPALLYDYGEGKSVVPLGSPILRTDTNLAAGATWEIDGLEYAVEASKTLENRETWQVTVRGNLGYKRTVWIEKGSDLLVGIDERVFMNQGTEYLLQIRLVGMAELPSEDFQSLKSDFAALVRLRSRLNRPQQSQEEGLTPGQRTALAENLPAVEKQITAGPLAKLVQSASRDLTVQSGRADAVSDLAMKHEGQTVEKFSLPSLGSNPLTDADLKGAVTVLHFWEYRDTPLKEPYGQVGYLEFLYNRHKAKVTSGELKVCGVAVDGRLNDEQTRRTAMTGVRKLKSFMNLTYPLYLDGGTVIKQFGDPRLVGAQLPLFVVIGPDGKILHYHVGFYEVDRQDGLKKLDALVTEALKKT
jgi:peroxiredoxin